MRRRVRDERGVAAVEFALMLVMLMGIVALAGPAVLAFNEQVSMGRATGRTLRFATAVPDQTRYDCDGNRIGRRPTIAQVVREAECQDPDVTTAVSPSPHGSLPGTEITVTLTKTVSLGPIGGFFGRSMVELESTSTGVLE